MNKNYNKGKVLKLNFISYKNINAGVGAYNLPYIYVTCLDKRLPGLNRLKSLKI